MTFCQTNEGAKEGNAPCEFLGFPTDQSLSNAVVDLLVAGITSQRHLLAEKKR